MAKLSILNENQSNIKDLSDMTYEKYQEELFQATKKIKKWTKKELDLYQNNKTPICIATEDGYSIGLYKLKIHPNKICDVYDRNHELVHSFENKINAILYVTYRIKRDLDTANEILELDSLINRNYNDKLSLQRGVVYSKKQQDFIALDAKYARLDTVEKRLKKAQERLLQIREIAKRIKIWQ